jgi:hypothetical protein
MSKKINWVKIMQDNRDKILEAFMQAKKETNGSMQGWHVDVEMDQDGNVWVTGLMSNGQSISSWNGETFIVGSVDSWNIEIDEAQWIENEEELKQEFEEQKDSEFGYKYPWQFMKEKHPDILQEWREEAEEYEIDNFSEKAEYLLNQRIEDEKFLLERG